MIGMPVNWPVREQHIRAFGVDQFSEFLRVRAIHNGVAVTLRSKERARFQDLARSFCLGNADTATRVLRCAGARFFAVIQIQKDHECFMKLPVKGKLISAV